MHLDLKTHLRESAGFILLILLIYQLFLSAILPDDWYIYSNRIAIWLILFVLGFTLNKWGKPLLTLLILISTIDLISNIFKLDIVNTISIYIEVLILFIVVGIYIYQTSKAAKINASVILQSINGYLLLALTSALIITMILNFDPTAFKFSSSINEASPLHDAQYMGLVTLSTLGYGDIVPKSPIARSISTLIAISGQLYLAIIIAMLVGKFASSQKKD